jgi:hypothetical protein
MAKTSKFFSPVLWLPACFALIIFYPIAAWSEDLAGNNVQSVIQADLAGEVNPEGVMLSVQGYRRWIREMDKQLQAPASYVQTGFGIGTTPAYALATLHVEWQPVIFANVRLQYGLFRYYGVNSALLSFPSADSRFGEKEVDALEGREQAGYGTWLMVRPTLYAKAGPVLIINQTDLSYFHFTGQGPYFLEWTYETLLKDGDHVLQNQTRFLAEAWKGPGAAQLLVGPYYETTHAGASRLTRNRVGGIVFWVPVDAFGFAKRPRLYAQLADYLHDRNREGEWYFALGAGFDFDL